MGRQNPPAKGEKALLVVRPENLGFSQDGGGIAMRIVNRLFEGDRINYEVVIPGLEQMKPFAMSVPFLPGTKLADADAAIYASFMPEQPFSAASFEFERLVCSHPLKFKRGS